MTAEKFTRRNKLIADHLEEIARYADLLMGGEVGGVLQPVHPQFREVLQAQERLLTAVERLLDQLPKQQAA
jgi:hypothetical protein